MFNVEEKFPVLFEENEDIIGTGQLLSVISSSNKYDLKTGDVMLITLPETDVLWADLIDECIAHKVHVIIPASNRDAAYIAQLIREEAVSVLAISPVLWPQVLQSLNTRPENITRMQVIISDGKGAPETRFSLLPGTIYTAYHLAPALREKAS